MNAIPLPSAPDASGKPRPEVRAKVRDLLNQTPSFHRLTPEKQRQVAHDTALIADALVGAGDPDMASVAAHAMADPSDGSQQFKQDQAAVDAVGKQPFEASSASEGAAVAGEFLRQVNFVEFVSGLIDGVFNSIVTSSIQQMEAYSKMVADVSKSLTQFRDENTTESDGQDHLLEQFPDVFDLDANPRTGSGRPTLKLRDGIDEDAALDKVRQSLGSYAEGGIDSIDVSDPDAQANLIKAARSHIATARQQLLATMVLMGLQRLVVSKGKIAAKVMFDFNASSHRTVSRTATAQDYARNGANLVLTDEGERESESKGKTSSDYDGSYESGKSNYTGKYDSDYYTKGKYKYAQKPILTAVTMASDTQVEQLTARASLLGDVEVHFNSDYMSLDKMATPEMMAAIQMRSKPVDNNKPIFKPEAAAGSTPAAASKGA